MPLNSRSPSRPPLLPFLPSCILRHLCFVRDCITSAVEAQMPPIMPSPTAPPRERRRAFKPRTATGCMTCRIRRVKCDEGEPSCRQCLPGRRICDGYPAKSQNSIFLIPPPLSPPLFNIEQEHRCFDFFRHRTAPRLSGSFESPFWNQLLLRATHHEPAI